MNAMEKKKVKKESSALELVPYSVLTLSLLVGIQAKAAVKRKKDKKKGKRGSYFAVLADGGGGAANFNDKKLRGLRHYFRSMIHALYFYMKDYVFQ